MKIVRNFFAAIAAGFVLMSAFSFTLGFGIGVVDLGIDSAKYVKSVKVSYGDIQKAVSPITSVQAGPFTDFAENKLIDALFRGQSLGAPATWYIGLDTVACTETGGGTEVTGGSYARVAITANLTNWAGTQSAGSTVASSGTSGQTSNNVAATFAAPTANWGQVVSFRFWDSLSGGNAWLCQTLTTAKTINNGDAAPSFSAGSLTVTADN